MAAVDLLAFTHFSLDLQWLVALCGDRKQASSLELQKRVYR